MTAASLRFAAEQLLQNFMPRHSVSRFTEDGNQPTSLAAGQKSPAFPRQRPDASAFG